MQKILQNKNILITAGPTREYLDPVRFLSNESTGKMGYAIAEALHNLNANVYLVSGPVSIASNFPKEKIIHVKTGKQMYEACEKLFNRVDIAIFCAAVADYTPKIMSHCKIKKSENELSMTFVKNVDIAFEFGKVKTKQQKSIGFALETDNVLEHAIAKLNKKNFDCIVANSPNKGEGFGYDTNKIAIINKDLSISEYPLKVKHEVAQDIVNNIINMYSIAETTI
ncbi:MAG: phosphopantothenoylcysteine decarboxylase [Flavobacteriales bacterium]|nr:phosphopantothenoylcysteine decarboxylase [Flavobacteriia bacterium]NCP04899.1 phosphopantothenoylcysteine decarboxylase [Flavobacteriales bacterium]PIV95223.1 MAG: phosphopantothenoylcysteine decarboxylase [Flavobacteriaceae bacterium CG17_big_fil_post_rev_8_21_14_2_50_33_15]PIY11697.1 MAG: phosphopantothenoylcysteine decarboxylase [Flavobacteriaceae bacterium CG_4_10_14_3_um_filter_33_47]PJB16946.1 MAG: phosphopantothenoylcysteine decarboxylase [Flavobacteriaceae bacterium CG_4_9_14_3_um_f